MDQIVRFNNQTAGRDKLFRLLQYSSRIIWATLEQGETNKNFIRKLKDLEVSLSTGRKLFRFGRGIDTLYSALSSIHLQNPTLRFSLTFSKIANALYLLSDHVIYMSRVGLINIDKEKWSKLYYKLWLYMVILNLYRDYYELRRILGNMRMGDVNHELQSKKTGKSEMTISTKLRLGFELMRLHKDVVLDTIKNGCDVCIPLTQLGYLPFSSKTVGILGAVSSLAGIIPLVDLSYKLTP